MNDKRILITGDIHADWPSLNGLINKKRPDIVLCCGDFGYWPELITYRDWGYNQKQIEYGSTFRDEKKIKVGDTNAKIYWAPGNHEHWWILEKELGRHGKAPIEMNPNLYYCPIGSIININGSNILFIGGADSIDKNARTIGLDWFPEEVLNHADFEFILKSIGDKKIDIVISHTCPNAFPMSDLTGRYDKKDDPTRGILNEVLRIYRPKKWRFGHWHDHKRGNDYGCDWMSLDYPKHGGIWWTWL